MHFFGIVFWKIDFHLLFTMLLSCCAASFVLSEPLWHFPIEECYLINELFKRINDDHKRSREYSKDDYMLVQVNSKRFPSRNLRK